MQVKKQQLRTDMEQWTCSELGKQYDKADWANANVSRQIEDTVLYGYYTLYSVILFCVFFWIPFVYFYYEEKDEDDTGKCTQVKMALKYTLGFVVICALLLLVG
uniref:LMBR1 domain containing 1 n=1 Tax=Ovis aries TaxID=9940 RepID=A0AC11EPP9_SHEEP